MRLREIETRLLVILSITILFTVTPAHGLSSILKNESFFDRQLDSEIEELFDDLKDPAAVINLYRIDELKFMVNWDGRVRKVYNKVIDDPKSPPLLRDHAIWLSSKLDMHANRMDEAEKKLNSMGFVTQWAVIGPFDNEGKIGFETAYPPETELDIEALYDGKERPVSWREYPDITRFKNINLGALFVPGTDVAAYALTFLRSHVQQDVAFRFGSDDAIKIWVDDVLLYADDGYHSDAVDQASVGVTLNEGWNKVLIKITQGTGSWSFNFCVTKPDGSPVDGITALARFSEIPTIIDELTPRETIEPVDVFDFVTELKRIADGLPEDAQAQANLGEILRRKHAFDADDKEDLKAFERAINLNPEEKSFYMSLAPLYLDRNKSRRAYERVLEINPSYTPAYYQLGNYYARSGYIKKAYGFYNEALAHEKTFYPAQIALAEHCKLVGRPDLSSKIISELTWLYETVPYMNFYSIGFSTRLIDDDELLRRCRKYLECDYTDPVTRQTMISIFRKRGQMDKVLDQWKIMYEISPDSLGTLIKIAEYYIDTMDFEKAQEYLDKVTAIRPEDPVAHELAGNISHWLDDTDAALDSWSSSLEVRPQNRDLREYIEYLKPKEEPFENKYKIDVTELLKESNPSPEDYPDDTSIILLDQQVFEVHPNGLSNKFVQQVVKVLQEKGIEDFKYQYAVYSPGQEQVDIQAAKIYKLDDKGNITKVINASGPFEQSLSGGASKLYYNVMAYVHFFSNIEVGDVVEYTHRVNQVAAENMYADYFGNITYIQTMLPKKRFRVVYITPAEKKFYYRFTRSQTEPEISEQDGKRIYSWTVENIPKIESEDRMPGLAEVTPYIHISTFEDWKDMGDWYWGLIQDQFTLNKQAKEITAHLVEGKETTLDKVRAIHNYVVTNTRYIGLEFGIHGHKPYKAYQVFDRKYGDCKDKATLIITMLKEVGVESDIVILRTRGKGMIEPFPASLAVFDHAICYIPELDLYLDGTAEYSGTGELPWPDQGTVVLLVSKNKREFTETPVMGPENNLNSDSFNVSIDEVGGITIDAKKEVTGQFCSYYRSYLQEEKTRKEKLEKSWRANVPTAKVTDLEFSDLKDLEKNIWYTSRVEAPDYAIKNGDGTLSFNSFFSQLDLTKTYAGLSERKYDIELGFPLTVTKTINYKLPEGYRVIETPEDFHGDTDFASFDITYDTSDTSITVNLTGVLKVDRINVKSYQDFRKFCQLVDEKQNEKIRIAK